MSNLQAGTFNTIGSASFTAGGSEAVWARVDKVIHFGRLIDTTSMTAGTVIPAGSMVIFSSSNFATIVEASDTANLSKVNGLTLNDVCIPEGVTFASCAIVTSGKIWADATTVPTSVESQLPNIEFIRAREGDQ